MHSCGLDIFCVSECNDRISRLHCFLVEQMSNQNFIVIYHTIWEWRWLFRQHTQQCTTKGRADTSEYITETETTTNTFRTAAWNIFVDNDDNSNNYSISFFQSSKVTHNDSIVFFLLIFMAAGAILTLPHSAPLSRPLPAVHPWWQRLTLCDSTIIVQSHIHLRSLLLVGWLAHNSFKNI